MFYFSCLVCKAECESERPYRKYCSVVCRANAQKLTIIRPPRLAEIPTGTTGAISELRAAIHLMGLGYNVFRALSQSSPFDLYAFRDTESVRVEVTTGHDYTRRTGGGNGAMFPTAKIQRLLDGNFDMLIIVFPDRIETLTGEQGVKDYRARLGLKEGRTRAPRRAKFK